MWDDVIIFIFPNWQWLPLSLSTFRSYSVDLFCLLSFSFSTFSFDLILFLTPSQCWLVRLEFLLHVGPLPFPPLPLLPAVNSFPPPLRHDIYPFLYFQNVHTFFSFRIYWYYMYYCDTFQSPIRYTYKQSWPIATTKQWCQYQTPALEFQMYYPPIWRMRKEKERIM